VGFYSSSTEFWYIADSGNEPTTELPEIYPRQASEPLHFTSNSWPQNWVNEIPQEAIRGKLQKNICVFFLILRYLVWIFFSSNHKMTVIAVLPLLLYLLEML
jgi:hypothetical protein